MTIFWIIAAALAFIGPLFVAVPLLQSRPSPVPDAPDNAVKLSVYRDHLAELDDDRRAGRLSGDQYEQARGDLENRLIDEAPDAGAQFAAAPQRRHRAAAAVVSIAMPLLALGLYLALGTPGALRPQPVDAAHGLGQEQMDSLISRLAARLERNPQDANGWAMLGRAQTVLGRFSAASAAYAKAVALHPDDAQLLSDYADALAMAQGGNLSGEPDRLVERALRADPDNAKALALAGTAAFDKKDFALALTHWNHLRSLIPPDSEFAKSIQASIAEAKSLSLVRGGKRVAAGEQTNPQAMARR